MNFRIRPCTRDDIGILADTIRASFRDVADRFGLTPDNCPRHASNCTPDWIGKDMDRGVAYFLLEHEGRVAGCVGLEHARPGLCYLERLAVLPGERMRGFGKALVSHVLSEAGKLGCDEAGIGVIAGQKDLKGWYRRLGFVETEEREFAHLPFLVTFMRNTKISSFAGKGEGR